MQGFYSIFFLTESAYVGCYQDHSKRILPKDFLTDKSMTVQKCQQFCRKKGFKYAGVEVGQWKLEACVHESVKYGN